jgi:hypothetical protein
MPQCQFPVFCYFCVSEKLHRNILGIGETKAEPPIFPEHESKSKAETEEGQDLATP